MPHLLPDVLTVHELPLAELHAAKLAGELFPLGGGFCPVDLPDGVALRAAAIAGVAPARYIADRMTAAWIWGAVAAGPMRHQFSIDIRSRHRQTTTRFSVREVVIDGAEIIEVAGALVTTVARTMIDLARDPSIADTAAIDMLTRLAGVDAASIDEASTRLEERPGLSFARNAARRIEAARSAVADPVHVVHGLDPAHGVQHPVEMRGVAHLEHEPAEGQAVA